MYKIEMHIVAIANSESQPNSFVVVLKEEDGTRRLPVVIGGFEAQAIAIAIESIQPNRPLTHDLFKNALVALGVQLQEVIVSELKEGVFYAMLVCVKENGEIFELDARTSDAIALAVRFGCPIYANAAILDEAGIALEEAPVTPRLSNPEASLDSINYDKLLEMLEDALGKEEYERAAEIRDELKRRTHDK
ncbi:MAG: bifunctional nuclease family protein [Saprospiraceae bacterium]|nr:bifunctional nuclease family protein [Saprospiraceae bacterium]